MFLPDPVIQDFGSIQRNFDAITQHFAFGRGAPTTSDHGRVGKLYVDETSGDLYVMTPTGWELKG